MGIVLKGWGSALPEKVVTNADFESRLDTNDAWIVERTGIRERRIGGTTGGLSVQSAEQAMDRAGIDPKSIDLILLATSTPDQLMPANSAYVQDVLGCGGGVLDINAACAGFVYGFITGAGMAELGAERVLVIGTDILSRITNPDDRGTAILFGDGSGAVVLERVEGPGNLLAWDLGADGSLRHILQCEHGGYVEMNGKEVFRQAVRVVVDSVGKCLEQAGVTPEDVKLFVPHQANVRIVDSVCQKLGLAVDRTAIVLDRTGNTSAASVPLALADAADAGRLEDGDIVILCGFGAGMTWATAVVRWGPA
jgi:3-oxoacyl-[acyl-carrier-protein] synthase-3